MLLQNFTIFQSVKNKKNTCQPVLVKCNYPILTEIRFTICFNKYTLTKVSRIKLYIKGRIHCEIFLSEYFMKY